MKTPKKQDAKGVTLLLRLDPELHEWLRQYAKTNDRSMNSQVLNLLKKAKENSAMGSTGA